jgi:glycosyltransferase involved in cell wall biosynthesis
MCKVSVIIPVYNVEKYLDVCIQSVLNQTLDNIEMILIDDGSTDTSGAICDKYASSAKVIHKVNGGLSSARNEGLKVATGEYIFFLDSDDWLELDALERLYSLATKYSVDFVRFRLRNEDGSKKSLGRDDLLSEGLYIKDKIEALYPYLICTKALELGIIIGVWRSLYKRSFLVENNLSFNNNIRYSEDILFSTILVTKANRFYYTEEGMFYHYRVNQSSISKSFRKDRWESYRTTYLEITKYFGKYGEKFSDQLRFLGVYFVLGILREYYKNDKKSLKMLKSDPVFIEMLKGAKSDIVLSLKAKVYLMLAKILLT